MASLEFFRQGDRVEEYRRAVGFSLVDADQEAFTGDQPASVTVITGRIDPERVEQAVTSDPEWKDDLERAEHNGDTYYRWGPELEVDPSRSDPVRPLGVGGRLAADDGLARFSNADAPIEEGLDVDDGDHDSLADVDDLAAAARALDDEEILTAILTDDGDQFTREQLAASGAPPEGRERVEDELSSAGDLPDWQVAAVTDAVGGDDQPRLVLVFVHDDGDGAEAHVAFLRTLLHEGRSAATGRRFNEMFTIDRLDADGTVVTAVLGKEVLGRASPIFFQREIVLAHR